MTERSEFLRDGQPSIESFDDLLAMARAEPHPCRLLTVLIKADTVFRRRGNAAEEAMDEGLLEPLMSRDWAVTPDLDLAYITANADAVSNEWRFLMTAIMPGHRGVAPTSDVCEPHLDRMVRALRIGADLSAFVFFDRAGTPVRVANTSA
jgi:hypothetical protein